MIILFDISEMYQKQSRFKSEAAKCLKHRICATAKTLAQDCLTTGPRSAWGTVTVRDSNRGNNYNFNTTLIILNVSFGVVLHLILQFSAFIPVLHH